METPPKIIKLQRDIKPSQFMGEDSDAAEKKKLKAEKLLASTKYLLKFGRQENLTTCFFDYLKQFINKTRLKNEQKSTSFPTKESIKIIEVYFLLQ